jgi:hypothetical protein
MPKLSDNRVPSYRLHKQSGQAIITLDGRDVCLGKFGSPQSKAQYNRLLAEWLANDRSLPTPVQPITVVEVADAFLTHANVYYKHSDGTLTGEVDNCCRALRPLLKLYATSTAANFTPSRADQAHVQMGGRERTGATLDVPRTPRRRGTQGRSIRGARV